MNDFFCRVYQKSLYVAAFFINFKKPLLLKGSDALLNVPQYLKKFNAKKPLVVTGKHVSAAGLLNPMYEAMTKAEISYAVFASVVPNPTVQNAEDALKVYKENGCDSLIAFGGGSNMDCAKAVGARVANPKKPLNKMQGLLKVNRKLPPLFAVPTTSGTGSETTLAAVITDGTTHHKYAINDPKLIPDVAVLDPSLTVNLPPKTTAATGMDALCHAVEAYIGKGNTAATKKYALQAIKLIDQNLYQTYINGGDLKARENMQEAAYLAGLAFTRAYVGCVHAVAHALGGKYNVAHGLANAVAMPIVLREYGEAAYKKLAEIAKTINLKGNSDKELAECFIAYVEALNENMGIPKKIAEIAQEDIAALADHAVKEANPLYPVPKILHKDDFIKIFKELSL